MSGDVGARIAGGNDEQAADDGHQGKSVTDHREDVFRCGGVGADKLADDGGRRGVEGHADRSEEEDHGARRQTREVVAGRQYIGAIAETEGGHDERDGAEEYTDTVIHRAIGLGCSHEDANLKPKRRVSADRCRDHGMKDAARFRSGNRATGQNNSGHRFAACQRLFRTVPVSVVLNFTGRV